MVKAWTPAEGKPAADSLRRPAAGPLPPTDARPRQRRVFFIRLGIGLALLVFLVFRLDFDEVSIAGPRWQALGVAVVSACMLLAQLVSAARWRLIFGQGAPSTAYLFRLYLIGNFFSLFLPSSIGGDTVRTVAAARATGRGATTVSSVVADRLAGVMALVFYLVIGAMLTPELTGHVRNSLTLEASPVMIALAFAGLLAAAAGAALVAPRIRPMLGKASAVFTDLAREPGRLMAVLVLALVVQGLYVAAWFALGQILGLRIPPASYLFTVPVVSLVAMLPVTLSGLGVREGAWLILLGPFGVASADAVAFSLLFFAAFTVVGGIGGLLFALRGLYPDPNGRRSDRSAIGETGGDAQGGEP
jgi:uncharacterized membrane protein YbhN (UPF0104 family)